MSKADGLKIGIKFTEDLVGDISGNESAFSITGKEYQYVNGNLIDKMYIIEKIERYPTISSYREDFNIGILLGTDVFEGALILGKDVGV